MIFGFFFAMPRLFQSKGCSDLGLMMDGMEKAQGGTEDKDGKELIIETATSYRNQVI